MPFDLASSSQPESNPFSEHASHLSSQACDPANPEMAHSSKQSVTAGHPATRAADFASDADQLSRHPFKMLPAAVFEQLSDPNLLSSNGNLGSNLLLGPTQPVQQQQWQQQEHKLDLGKKQSDENHVQSLMVRVQQKPVWMGSNAGTTLLLLLTRCIDIAPNLHNTCILSVWWTQTQVPSALLLCHATVRVTSQDMCMLSFAIDIRSLLIQPATLHPMLPAYKGRCHLDHSTFAAAKHESAVIVTK